MKITEQIAQHLLDTHNGGNWTDVDLTETLTGIDLQFATTITPFSPNTIAAILHHISFWNRAVAERGRGSVPVVDEKNGYDLPAMNSENDWQKLKADNLRSANELAEVIRSFDEAKLEQPILTDHSSAYKNFQGQVEHVHYHLGQIVMLKKYLQNI